MIDFVSPQSGKALTAENNFLASNNGEKFPVINDIPRFVELDNYANAFGLQWKSFAKIQLDSSNGSHISKERLERCVGASVNTLSQKNVLEVGCGAGRFTEHLVKAGAYVHAVDLSEAVEVNHANMGNASNYKVAQANVYALPFAPQSFDVVICIGVIQHTPNPEKTINALFSVSYLLSGARLERKYGEKKLIMIGINVQERV